MAIGTADKYIARMMLQNKIYACSGQAYEDLFGQVMQRSNANFELVKAHGNSGDKKNDGFDKGSGTFYQVYAPDDISKPSTIRDGAKKLRNDFDGLYAFWNALCPIREYYFVINDRYKGVAPEIHQELLCLSSKYPEINFHFFLAKDLEDTFLALDMDGIVSVVGFLPDPTLQLDFSALTSVIEHLMNSSPDELGDEHLVIPDFEEKIAFNHLSEKIAVQLRNGSYQVGALEKYFSKNSEYTRADVQSRFVAAYNKVSQNTDPTLSNYADLVFVGIIDEIYPKGTIAIRNAVIVLMAYYFESCDIFEPPEMEGDEK